MAAIPENLRRFLVIPPRIRALLQRIALRSYILGLCGAITVGGAFVIFTYDDESSQAANDVTVVSRGNIVTTVSAIGQVTFASEQQLKFNQKGTVAAVHVQEGDHVTQGQVIAELDKTTVLADVRQSQLAVGASALQLRQLQVDREKEILDAENSMREAERQLLQAQETLLVTEQQLPSTIAAAERSVEEKTAALKQAQLELEKTRETETQSIAATAQNILMSSEKLLDSFYDVLTRGGSARPSQGTYTLDVDALLYTDFALKLDTEWDYLGAVNAADDMRKKYGATLSAEKDPDVIVNALSDAEALAQAISALGENAYALLQGATTDPPRFTVEDLQAYRNTVNTNRTTAKGLVNDAVTAQANLAAVSAKKNGGIPSVTLQQKIDAVQTAENALALAQENLEILQTKNPADLAKQKDAVAKMQEDYASKKAGLTNTTAGVDIQIQLKQNDVAQRAASLAKTQKTVDDYQIVAPFDGIVRRLDFKVGDNLLADTAEEKYVVLENRDFLIVTILLDQVDVVRVRTGMNAHITFDAVPGQTFEGAIDEINPTPVEQSGVVSYEVSVKLPTPADLTILSGMTAVATIDIASKTNVLTVPNLALQHAGDTTTVRTPDGQSITVETGVTDGKVTEILSGVSEGDAIVSVNLASETTATDQGDAARQFMRGMGGFGGPSGGGTRTNTSR